MFLFHIPRSSIQFMPNSFEATSSVWPKSCDISSLMTDTRNGEFISGIPVSPADTLCSPSPTLSASALYRERCPALPPPSREISPAPTPEIQPADLLAHAPVPPTDKDASLPVFPPWPAM